MIQLQTNKQTIDYDSSRSRHCTGFSTTTSFEAGSCLFSRRILFGHASGFESLALCFDGRDNDDDSVFDTATDGEEGCCSESLLALVIVDKLWAWGRIKPLPAFCCSSKIFCKYLACSSMRNWRALCTLAKVMQKAEQLTTNMKEHCGPERYIAFNSIESQLVQCFLPWKGRKI